jgi:hypothetical protein
MKYLTDLLKIPREEFGKLDHVFHYLKPECQHEPYAVWQETTESSFHSDNKKSERILEGILDYFTTEEDDSFLDTLEAAMDAMGASWTLSAVQFEEQTNLIHFSWDWQVK